MLRRSLLLSSLSFVLAAGTLSADLRAGESADSTAPASCLTCRHTDKNPEFVKCLSQCMTQKDGIGLAPIETDDIRLTLRRWTFTENPDAGYGKPVKTAALDSDSAFRAFNRRVEPKFVLTRERSGQKRIYLDLNPAKLSPFGTPVRVRINRGKPFVIPGTAVWANHAFLIDDPNFYREIQRAERLTFSVETVGTMEENVHFDTAGIRRVFRWLDGHP